MKKLILSLALLLAVSMSAFAKDFLINGIAYTVLSEADKTVEVCVGSSFNGSELIIPEKVTYSEKEYTVTGIGRSAFFYNTSVTSVSIPATVKTIGINAFGYCSNLTSCIFEGESQLEQISDNAFRYTVLTTIDIPASVTSIGSYAFDDDTELKQVYMHRDDPSGYSFDAFFSCPNLVIYAPAALYEIYNKKLGC